jgi:hypothetical protein
MKTKHERFHHFVEIRVQHGLGERDLGQRGRHGGEISAEREGTVARLSKVKPTRDSLKYVTFLALQYLD